MILAIDPGTTESGWCLFDDEKFLLLGPGARVVRESGEHPNAKMLDWVMSLGDVAHTLAIEMVASYGMAVGVTTFETVRWIGRFQQAWHDPEAVRLVYRKDVKLHLCQSLRAKDKNIRQALIDRLGKPGTKGVTGHAWSALAVAVTTYDKLKGELA